MKLRAMAIALMCAECKDPPALVVDAAPPPMPSVSATALSTAAPVPTREPEPPPAPLGDAGIGACRPVDGPAKLTRPGPYAVVTRMGFVDFYAQENGAPALAGSVRVDALGSAPVGVAPPVAGPSDRRGIPACAAAGLFAFCTNSAGEIRRFRFSAVRAEPDNFVARARPGGNLAAALVNGHTVVAYLRDRTTSEGVMTEAYLETDDGTETRLSEDGAGATSVALVARGQGAVAIFVDARRAMSPVHARNVTVAPKLALGKDAVLFVGGSAEPSTRAALGVRGATAFALVPIAHDLSFGVATVKIDAEPATDAPIAWSDYPNGLDPAPIAAVSDATDARPLYVARVRPSAPKFGSPRVLELGTLDAAGAFSALGLAATRGAPLDVAIASDGAGGVVLAYTDSAGGFAERLVCDKK